MPARTMAGSAGTCINPLYRIMQVFCENGKCPGIYKRINPLYRIMQEQQIVFIIIITHYLLICQVNKL